MAKRTCQRQKEVMPVPNQKDIDPGFILPQVLPGPGESGA